MANFALVLTENVLHKNSFVGELTRRYKPNIKLIIQLDFKHHKSGFINHYRRYIQLLGLKGLVYTFFLIVNNKIKYLWAQITNTPNSYSLKQLSIRKNIHYAKINNVNSDEFLQLLEKHDIDYVINSANQIYKKKVLDKWSEKILNRHSSIVPSYGGIYPIFWQMLNGDKKGGVTLHWIDSKIDEGLLAYYKEFDINLKKSLFWHYKIAFDISLELCSKAIEDLSEGKVSKQKLFLEKSYYTWPEVSDIKRFKKKGLKIV
ncbi:MAG: formyltransferase family protein [bacterium]